jgi:PRTRC genetic system ThiF family protein
MKMKKTPAQTIDLSFARAARVVPETGDAVRFFLVGCGGTGSWLAPSIARLARVLAESGREVSVTFVDDDRVEEGNIPRQNFCDAEKGLHKSVALAVRYSAAWNVEIAAVTDKFYPALLTQDYGGGWRATRFDALTVVVGCVDNAKARRSIHAALKGVNRLNLPQAHWWVDCGNSEESGQVLCGSAPTPEHLKGAFPKEKLCRSLPAPSLVAPELLKARQEERAAKRMSCAELMAANVQSLMVNQRVAAEAGDYLYRLTGDAPLRKFATYFDCETGNARSLYATREEVARVARVDVAFLTPPAAAEQPEGGRRRA